MQPRKLIRIGKWSAVLFFALYVSEFLWPIPIFIRNGSPREYKLLQFYASTQGVSMIIHCSILVGFIIAANLRLFKTIIFFLACYIFILTLKYFKIELHPYLWKLISLWILSDLSKIFLLSLACLGIYKQRLIKSSA